jgi:PIN domain nuclease of toxin-antitoxin system
MVKALSSAFICIYKDLLDCIIIATAFVYYAKLASMGKLFTRYPESVSSSMQP